MPGGGSHPWASNEIRGDSKIICHTWCGGGLSFRWNDLPDSCAYILTGQVDRRRLWPHEVFDGVVGCYLTYDN